MAKRIDQISRDIDNFADTHVGIQDIDATIQYYFENVIKPAVNYDDDEIIKVPLKYASAER